MFFKIKQPFNLQNILNSEDQMSTLSVDGLDGKISLMQQDGISQQDYLRWNQLQFRIVQTQEIVPQLYGQVMVDLHSIHIPALELKITVISTLEPSSAMVNSVIIGSSFISVILTNYSKPLPLNNWLQTKHLVKWIIVVISYHVNTVLNCNRI